MNRLFIRLLIIASAAILIVSAFYFIFRDPILRKVVFTKADHFNNTHEANVRYARVYFDGPKTIRFDSLFVTPGSNDTLLFVGSLSAGINFWQLIGGHIRFRKLGIEHAFIHFEQNKTDSYFGAFTKTSGVLSTDSSEINLYAKTERLLKRVFATIPSKLIVKDAALVYSKDSLKAKAYVDLLQLKNGKLTSTIRLTGNQTEQAAIIEGIVKPKQRAFELSVKPHKEGTLLRSPLAGLFGATLHYSSLAIDFSAKEKKGNILRLEGNCSFGRFEIDYKTLSSKKITFPGCIVKLNLSVGTNFFELDSISEINVGKLTLHPYLKYGMSPSDTLVFLCNIPNFTVSDFFTSLPPDMFPNLKGIEAEGSLAYRAKLLVDLKQPDSLRLESDLYSKDFKVTHIDGELLKMNTPFVYTAYERGLPMRTIEVGPDNTNYCPLNQVPSLIQNAVLIAEDGLLYSHKGFSIESIRYAIAQNIKERKLFRGGSTISQQLVKNVYLSREKTLTRKLEEIILVWLIESNRLVPKSRMFEVYLNIIEWGPNVYGVSEASRFYFNKDVPLLNATECIFLASVIPSPKKFYWRFDKEGRLAPFMMAYYNDISEKMFNRGLLCSSNGDSLASILKITGPAKEYLRSNTPTDSVQTVGREMIPFFQN